MKLSPRQHFVLHIGSTLVWLMFSPVPSTQGIPQLCLHCLPCAGAVNPLLGLYLSQEPLALLLDVEYLETTVSYVLFSCCCQAEEKI